MNQEDRQPRYTAMDEPRYAGFFKKIMSCTGDSIRRDFDRQSNDRPTAVESKSNRRCNHRVMEQDEGCGKERWEEQQKRCGM